MIIFTIFCQVNKILDRDVLVPLLALFRDYKIDIGIPRAENFRKRVGLFSSHFRSILVFSVPSIMK
jgi:hypothetical protein